MLYTPVSWPGEFHGLYSPWGRKESDTTERLSYFGTKVLRVQEQWLITITEHTCLYFRECRDGEKLTYGCLMGTVLCGVGAYILEKRKNDWRKPLK